MQIHWHRSDLRAADNRGLAAAASATKTDEGGETHSQGGSEPVLPVFVFDEAILDHAADARVRYMLDALAELRAWYRDRGSDLLFARGDPATVLPELAAKHDADRIVWNNGYSGLARERDARVRRALNDRDITRESFHDAVFHEPGSITTNDGDPYSVFTYFGRKWQDRPKPDPIPAPDEESLADAAGDPLPTIQDLGFAEPDADVHPAGTEAARRRLADFCDDAIFRYETDRDYPAREGVSRLSADLKFGTVGIREVYAATEEARERAERGGVEPAVEDDEGESPVEHAEDEPPVERVEVETAADRSIDEQVESIEEFQMQLAWREFYTQVLFYNPDVVTRNYKQYENDIEWRDDPDELQAWKDGKTGYPIVDAGMRQLKREAYMHNRVRMIVASFLTKDLLLDWREGYDHFRGHLADHDTASDTGGWQWAASTGTDAQPYFRIFNPMTQGERYDPDAEYIKEYVPELRDLDPDTIHEWDELSPTEYHRIAPGYPAPIVDHDERREAALSMFEAARGDE